MLAHEICGFFFVLFCFVLLNFNELNRERARKNISDGVDTLIKFILVFMLPKAHARQRKLLIRL